MKKLITIVFYIFITNAAYSQISGTVKNTENQPVELATVALYSLPDSTLITGTVTNMKGGFLIESSENIKSCYLKISCIGYETLILYPIANGFNNICLKYDKNVLDEVVVKGFAPTVTDKDGRLIFSVKNSPFYKNYSASDLLIRTPFISFTGSGLAIDGSSAELRINGVKQDLTGISLSAFLSSLKSENIKHIEVQMGRTADVEANLPGGVIDIILEEKKGLNGNVYSELNYNGRSYEQKTKPIFKGIGGGGITFGTNDLHFYANIYGSAGKSHGVKSESNYLIKDIDKAINSKAVSPFELSKYYSANAGLSYRANKNNVFNIECKYSTMPENSSSVNSNSVILKAGNYEDSLQTFSNQNITDLQLSITGSHVWKNRLNNFTINSMLSYLNYKSENIQNTLSRYKLQIDDNSNETGITQNTSSMLYAQSKAEYTFTNKVRALAGLKYTRTQRESDYKFTSDKSDDSLSTNYKFTEELPSAFINLSKNFDNGLYLSIGLRGEYTHLTSQNSNVDISYFDLFPSSSLSYRFKNNVSLNIGYSRSIFRPSFALLNNYKVKLSDYIYSLGNPTLEAQITDNVNIRLSKNRHSLSASYSYSANPIMEKVYSEDSIIYIKNMNTGVMHTTSLSYRFNGNISKIWFLSANAGLSYISFPENIYYNNIFQGYATAYNTIKLSESISSDISLKYASPWIMNDRKVDSRFSLDFDVKYNITSKLTLNAGIKNLLRKGNTVSITDNLYANHYYWRETAFRNYTIRLTYNFSKGENIKSNKVNDENYDRFRL